MLIIKENFASLTKKRSLLLYLQTFRFMKYFAAILFLLAATFSSFSQTYEIGGMLGGTNYIGDIGKTNYIAPNNVAFGGIFKWNRSSRHSFRGSLMVARISGDDNDSKETRRKQRT